MSAISAFLFGMFIGAEITFILIYAFSDDKPNNTDSESDNNNN